MTTAPSIDSFLVSAATAYGSSKWGTLAHCPEAYDLHYEQGVQLRYPPNYFGVGSIVHAGQAWQLSGNGKWKDVLSHLRAKETHAEDGALTDAKILDEAERLLHDYYAFWGEDGGWGSENDSRVIAVEQEIVGTMPDGSFYSVRADHIREHFGEVICVDTKTSSRVPNTVTREGVMLLGLDEYARSLATRPQFLGLSWLVGKMFAADERPVKLIDDLIVKTKVPAFARVEVIFTPEMVAKWQAEHLKLLAVAPRRNMHACAPEHTRRCDYFEWCHGNEDSRIEWYVKGNEAR